MPRVKIDYVVSFSSEDPEHPASNLLAWEVSKKKWLCKKGESSCSVVLQLAKAVKISAVHIGAYHSALVEVLVARSEKASDQFQVLVPSCVFVPPGESRRDEPAQRVRSFSADQLAADVRHQRWDRLRVVCSQPYNKHCKYGLSFIHIDEAGESNVASVPQVQVASAVVPPASVPQRLLALDTFSSDEDDFRPGELFAQHLQKNNDSSSNTTDTGAQIRQATSQALKNISDSSTKLMKTPISKPAGRRERENTEGGRADRSRDGLMYTDEDERPHTKIDHVVQRHKDHKRKEDKEKPQAKHQSRDKEKLKESSHREKDDKRTPKRKKSPSPQTPHSSGDPASRDPKRTDDRKKRQRLNSEDAEKAGEVSSEPHTLLQDCVVVLSGYENPQRANIRNTALALGARVQRDWGSGCTHLICAFPNTPKLRAVRASGSTAPAVLADWVLQCAARRRRLPCCWFATEPHLRRDEPQPAPATTAAEHSDTEGDTDDEIEKVLRQRETKRAASRDEVPAASPAADDCKRSSPTDTAAPLSDEEGPSTDECEEPAAVPKFGGALPNFFEGHTFVIDAEEEDAQRLARYITAYGGLVLQISQLEESSSVDYMVCGRVTPAGRVRGARVTPAWLARCHRAGALLPPDITH